LGRQESVLGNVADGLVIPRVTIQPIAIKGEYTAKAPGVNRDEASIPGQ